MTEEQLKQIGLSASQAKAYILLVNRGKLDPATLISQTGESRTNSYMVLDRLVQLGLAYKDEQNKKLVYRPSSPVGLQKLAEKQRAKAFETEQKIKDAMPELLNYYHERRTQPGVTFVQGREGLKSVYRDHLASGGNAKVIRTKVDNDYYGEDLEKYLEERAARGIVTDMISPYQEGMKNLLESNALGRTVTFVPNDAYSQPVEIMIYGTKVTITSFGEEAVATIIESPQIAEAMRQIYELAKAGADTMQDRLDKPTAPGMTKTA